MLYPFRPDHAEWKRAIRIEYLRAFAIASLGFGLDDIVFAEIKFSVMQKHLPFPRSRRLTLNSEFQRVRTEGFSIRGEILTIGFLKNAEACAARAGFITSRRVGSAVVRNRTRRRLREIFRRHQHELNAGIWIVTIASPRAAGQTFPVLEDEWLRLVQRASILAL